mgnify:CR=1 FL=1
MRPLLTTLFCTCLCLLSAYSFNDERENQKKYGVNIKRSTSEIKLDGKINEAAWKENFVGKTLTEEQLIEAMIQFPKLIERPIVINGNKAVIGRPPENILDII